MLYHYIQQLLAAGHKWDEMLYLNFEDERLENFDTEDFNKLLECHQEMYGKRPMLFLDEVQNIDSWHKFARRMADAKYTIFITGSNAKMLSGEINTTLGGRFLIAEVYPYSFKEFLAVHHVSFSEIDLLATEGRARVIRTFDEYLRYGGLPAAALLPAKRDYLSSIYQKIYMGDIIARNKITNVAGIRVLVRKMAESVCRPISYNRINNLLSSVGGKLSLATTIKYVEYCEEASLLRWPTRKVTASITLLTRAFLACSLLIRTPCFWKTLLLFNCSVSMVTILTMDVYSSIMTAMRLISIFQMTSWLSKYAIPCMMKISGSAKRRPYKSYLIVCLVKGD